MRDMVEVGWGRNQLGANISVHICQASFFNFESKSIRATVRRKEIQLHGRYLTLLSGVQQRPHCKGEIWKQSFISTSRNRSNAKTISKLKELKTPALNFSVDGKSSKTILKPEELKTQTLCFSVDGKNLENGTFRKKSSNQRKLKTQV